MSLINEALRKARLEAARQESAEAGLAYPAAESARSRGLLPVSFAGRTALAVFLLLFVGGVLFWLGQRSAASNGPIAVVREQPEGAVTGPQGDTEATPVGSAAPAAVPTASQPDRTAAAGPSPSPPPVEQRGTAADSSAPAVAPRERSRPAQSSGRPAAEPPPTARTQQPASSAHAETQTPAADPPIATPAAEPSSAPSPPTATAPPRQADRQAVAPPPEATAETATPESSNPVADSARVFVGEAEVEGGVLSLGGIAWTRDRPFALINGRVVGRGDRIQSLTVATVEPRQVVLRDDRGEILVLQLR